MILQNNIIQVEVMCDKASPSLVISSSYSSTWVNVTELSTSG